MWGVGVVCCVGSGGGVLCGEWGWYAMWGVGVVCCVGSGGENGVLCEEYLPT